VDENEFEELVAKARAGDERALEAIFRSLHPRLVRFLRAGEPRVADDLAGEVWMAVARGLATFEGDAAGFRAWVFSIARRRIADHRRKSLRREVSPTPTSTFEELDGASDPAALVVDQLSGEAAAQVIAALLPEQQAEVVLLRVLGDLSVDEVAAVLGKSPNWVRVNQHRGLRRLAERLDPKVGVIR